MIVLAFDTALGACSVGLWQAGTVLAQESITMTQGHAEVLVPMIERVMDAGQLTYADLDRIAVAVGPGSFTGLRVGIATARGLAMAAQKPAIGVTTTEALAKMAMDDIPSGTCVVAVIDSKRGDVYAQAFDESGMARSDIANVADDALAAWCDKTCGEARIILVGDASARVQIILGHRAAVSSAPQTCGIDAMARIAIARAPDHHGPVPVYVRAPDVTLSPTGGQLRP